MNIRRVLVLLLLSSLSSILFSVDVSIVPESFLREWDPITIFYSDDIGPINGGALDDPSEIISIEPYHPGEYRWVDSRTLQFNPTTQWPPLKTYRIKSFDREITLSTMMLQPVTLYPSNGSRNLEPLSYIELSFETYINPELLESILTFDVKPLPGVGDEDSYILTSKDYQIDEIEGSGRYYKYGVTLKRAVDYGKSIDLILSLSSDSSIEGSTAKYNFTTKDEFRVISMGSGYTQYPISNSGSVYSKSQSINAGTGNSPLFIEFSEYPQNLSVEDIKKLVSFEPAVKNLTFNQSGKRVYLKFNVDKETPYKFIINNYSIKSRSGRPLADLGETSLYFYYKNLSPYIKWQTGQVLTERFGPKYIPMEGRATESVDLRVYKIDAKDSKYWPFPKNPVVVNEAKTPLMPGEDEFADSISEYIKLLQAPPVSTIAQLPIDSKSSRSTFGLNIDRYLTSISGKNQPGTYLVGYRPLGESVNRNYVKVVVTDLSLTTVEEESGVNFVVTSLDSGEVISGVKVELQSYIYNSDDKTYNWENVVSGFTNDEGQFYYKHIERLQNPVGRIVVSKDSDILILDTKSPPPSFTGNHWYSYRGDWLGWLTSEPRSNKFEGETKGYVFTERPIYKPEEEVHIVGFIRERAKGLIKKDTLSEKGHSLFILGPGRKQWEYPISLGGNDQFYINFNELDLPTGNYTVHIKDNKSGRTLASTEFKKEAYRVPKFELNITGDSKVPSDKPFNLELIADYYAGGRVAGQSVNWSVTKYPYFAYSSRYPGFSFASDERFSGYGSSTSIGSSNTWDKTDENGTSKLVLNPAAENGATSIRYVIEATVRGADAQTVTDSKEVLALPPFSLGLKVEKLYEDINKIDTEVLFMGFNEEPVAEREFTVRLYKKEWHSYLSETDFTTGEAKYISDVVSSKISENIYKSIPNEPTPISFKVEEAGIYIVEILAYDDLGRLQKVKSDFFVSGDTPTSWEKTQSNIFETVLDKKSYNPGDTVTMLLKSPYQSANALVVMETPLKNEYHFVKVENGQGILKFKVKNNMVPGLPIHTLLMRGRIPGSGLSNSVDRGKPVSMGNTTWINVNPENNQLNMKLTHPESTLPGEKIKLEIDLEDAYGNSVDGDVVLWLVDRAVLSLGEEKRLAPLDAFIDPVQSYVSIKDIRNSFVGNLPVEEVPGGGGDDMAMMESAMRNLLDNKSVRKNFRTVAYFNDDIKVINGKAVIEIDMPDNLTEFAVRAVATSGYDKFGVEKSTIAIRLPVIVQSAMPRFIRPGDSFVAGGIARVVEGESGPGFVQIGSDGLIIDINDSVELTKEPVKLLYPIDAPLKLSSQNSVKLTMGVERASDGATDGFEVEIPVNNLNLRGEKSITTLLEEGDIVNFPMPKNSLLSNSVDQTAYISSNRALINMLQGLSLLESYPHGCLEQRISQLYPLISMENILSDYNIEDKYSVDKNIVDSFISYLESSQSSNGLYGYWPGSTPYVGLSAYTLEFINLLNKNGYKVSNSVTNNLVSSLKRALRTDFSYLISEFSLRDRIDAFTALSNYGYFDRNYASDLLNAAENSNLYNKAKMVRVYYENGRGSNKTVDRLIDDLWSATTFNKNGGTEYFTGLIYKNSRWGGIINSSKIETLSEVVKALIVADPKNEKLPLIVDYLVKEGDNNGWGSTKSTSSALLAIKDSLNIDQNSGRSSVVFNGDEQDIDSSLTVLQKKSDKPIEIEYSKGREPLYLWLRTNYTVDSNLKDIKEESNGFLVSQEFIRIENSSYGDVTKVDSNSNLSFNIDDVLEAHITVINSDNSNFVAITIPLAAGFDPLNPNLLTSPPEAKSSGKITRTPTYSIYADDKVVYYYDSLPKGTYDFYFRLKATTSGSFTLPPAFAEKMYEMSFRGNSNGGLVNINE